VKEFAGIARPGDTVIVALSERMTDEELSDFRENFEGFLDATGVHLAIVEGVSQMLIVRPGDDVEGIDKEFPDEG
jgi:hypothetical protein